jgi:Na+-transporting methylmalonyl-CoA/oxaloacetate decarboxylase gamma subunit
MRYLLLALVLTGCSTIVPVAVKWPDIPKEVTETCPTLKETAKDTTKLSVVVDTVVQNYSTYYECQAKHEAWTIWYQEQKRIYEEIK